MSEFDTYHDQKVEDFEELTKDFLDGEIRLHEQVIITPFPSKLQLFGDELIIYRFSLASNLLDRPLMNPHTLLYPPHHERHRCTNAISRQPLRHPHCHRPISRH